MIYGLESTAIRAITLQLCFKVIPVVKFRHESNHAICCLGIVEDILDHLDRHDGDDGDGLPDSGGPA